MSEDQTNKPRKGPKEVLKFTPAVWWTLRILAFVLWGVYLFAPPQFQTWLNEYSPIIGGLYYYKFWFLLGLLVIGAPVLQIPWRTRWVTAFGYLLFFPFIVVYWTIRAAYSNIEHILIFSPSIYSAIRYFKPNIFFFSIAIISAIAITRTDHDGFIVIGMICLFIYLGYHFVGRFSNAFANATVFSDLAHRIPEAMANPSETLFPSAPDNEDTESEEYKKQMAQNLIGIYGVYAGIYFTIRWITGVLGTQRMDLYFAFSILYSFIVCTVVFALEFYALERIEPGSFEGSTNLLSFFGLSFGILLTSSDLASVVAVAPVAIAMTFAALFSSLLIVIMLVFVLLTSVRERFQRDLNNLKAGLESTGEAIGTFLEQNYALTLAAAEILLLERQPLLAKYMLKARYGSLPKLEKASESVDEGSS